MASSSRVSKTFGGINIKNFLDAGNNVVRKVKKPSDSQDAANKEYVDRFNKVGDIKMSVHNSDFSGWLKCDGRSLSRTTYATLFAVIGTSFGNVDSNTFNLPDCRGRVLGTVGQGSGLTNRTLGASVGAETHTLTTSEIPSHTHTVANTVVINGASTTTATDNSPNEINLNTTQTTTSGATGGGGAHNNMQPTVFIGNVFIYSGLE
jgi:microcystin-dependent protein